MGFQNTELSERVLQHGGISLEHLSVLEVGAIQTLQSAFSKDIFPGTVSDHFTQSWGLRDLCIYFVHRIVLSISSFSILSSWYLLTPVQNNYG